MNKLWLKITGFVVLVGVAIIAVNVFRPGQTPIAESRNANRIQKEQKSDFQAQPKTPAYDTQIATVYPNSAGTENAGESLSKPPEQNPEQYHPADKQTGSPYLRNSQSYIARRLRRKPSERGREQYNAPDGEMTFEYSRNAQVYKPKEPLHKMPEPHWSQGQYYDPERQMSFQSLGGSQTNKVVELLPPQWHQRQYPAADRGMGFQYGIRGTVTYFD